MSRNAFLLVVLHLLSELACGNEAFHQVAFEMRREGEWHVAETQNFFVVGLKDSHEITRLAQRCEFEARQLCQHWLNSTESPDWSPKCYVVLHPDARSYTQEAGLANTAGSTLIERKEGAIQTRRIDLRADHPLGYADALVHELTHVVTAEHFPDTRLPPWADEGMAVLGDSERKQSLHDLDVRTAHRQGRLFNARTLLSMTEAAPAPLWPVFYGQSTSIVRFLLNEADPQTFLKFVRTCEREGHDSAVRAHYRFDNLAHLERAWLDTIVR